MYRTIAALHSLNRWIVFILAVLATLKALQGSRRQNPYASTDRKLGLFLMIGADTQLLLGLLLYFVYSPITHAALANFGAAMKNSTLRYWAVEHTVAMILAWLLVHVGYARIKRSSNAVLKHRRAFVFFGLATLLMIAGMPWPFLRHGRPLMPIF